MSRSLEMTRRAAVMSGAALVAGCATGPGAAPTTPGRALWLRVDGRDVIRKFSGAEPVVGGGSRPFDETRAFRIASISKLAVAEAARGLARAGVLSLNADVSDGLDRNFRHPEFPDAPITLRHLLAHLSGVADPDVYWVAAPGDIREVLGAAVFTPGARPGSHFQYANLNYGIAATVMEQAAGMRFDKIAQRFAFAPAGLTGIGFNGSGMSAARIASGAALWRGGPGAWEAQVDGVEARAALTGQPSVLVEGSVDIAAYLDGYTPGTNGTLFSPQGGLRAGFADLMAMGEAWLLDGDDAVLWDAAFDPGETLDGHFVQFGLGRYHYPAERSPVPGVRLVGHMGEAYGFHGGLWAAPERDAVFAFGELGSAPAGVPMNGQRPKLRVTNAAFFGRIADVLSQL